MHSDFSKTFNFDEAVRHDVDPRTGMYPVIFSLGEIVSQDFYGVNFTLRLRNDPLDSENYGFGQSWKPLLTCYDKANGKLVTSDGRHYDFDGTTLQHHYDVRNFIIKKDEVKQTIDIVYRNGITERCSTRDDINYMTDIFSPEGKNLMLSYESFEKNGRVGCRLKSIMDVSASRYLDIDYTDPEVSIVCRKQGTVYYTCICRIENERLYFVSLPNTRVQGTKLAYEEQGGSLLVTRLIMPTGYTETITYEAGHKLPPSHPLGLAGLERLPRVARIVHGNGIGQEDTVREFSYSEDANYLGLYGDKPWDDTYGDNAYTAPASYGYFSLERINGRRSVKRSYNRFHALVEELELADGIVSSITQYDYHGNVADSVDRQPRNFLLPREVRTFSYESSDSASAETTRTYSYDEEGNLLESSDGHLRLRNTFVPAADDPLGFTRLPASSSREPVEGGTATTEWFSYGTRPYPAGSSLTGAGFPYLIRKATSANMTLEYSYDWEDDRLFGRLAEIQTVKDATMSTRERRSVSFDEEKNLMIETYEIQGPKSDKTRQTVVRSLFSGMEVERSEASGRTIRYTYDPLGRVVTIVASTDEEAATTQAIEYDLEGEEKKISIAVAGGEIKDTLGYNARGNLVSLRRNGRLLEERQYDAFGQLVLRKIHDATPDDASLATYAYTYDARGRMLTVRHVESDTLLEQRGYNAVERSSWSRVPGMAYEKEYRDSAGNIVKTERYSAADTLLHSEEYEYDGFSRLLTHTSGTLVKQYSYDLSNRVDAFHVNEDGVIGTCAYAAFTEQPLMEELRIDMKPIASRSFDSLGRIVSEKLANTRGASYDYENAGRLPVRIESRSGTQRYRNNDHQDKPLHMQLDAEEGAAQSAVSQSCDFSYDAEGRVVSADNRRQLMQFSYSPAGFLLHQSIYDIDADKRFSASAEYSLRGRLLARTDYLGMQTRYAYNGLGLLTGMNVGDAATVTLSYDGVNRPVSRVVRLSGDATPIECRYVYDEAQGPIAGKETWIGENRVHYETYAYTNDGMLRRVERGFYDESPTVEEYTYDAHGRMIGYRLEKDGASTSTGYVFDSLNNILEVNVTLPDGSSARTAYSLHDGIPCQIKSITDSRGVGSTQVTVDEDGCIVGMGGTTYAYDLMGRLVSAQNTGAGLDCTYGYDPFGALYLQTGRDASFCRYLSFGGAMLNCMASDGDASYVSDMNEVFLERRSKEGTTAERYLITDYKGSVVAEIEGGVVTQRHAYSPYGEEAGVVSRTGLVGLPLVGFNGALCDPVFPLYHPGNGHRSYCPQIMRFLEPDSLSPFDGGGINPYIYCVGNPVNLIDPSGRLSGRAIAAISVGVLGLLLSLFTFGVGMAVAVNMAGAIIVAGSFAASGISATAATTTALSVTSSALGLASSSLSIASSVLAERGRKGDAELSASLAWGATGTGLASMITGIGGLIGSALMSRATAAITPRVLPNMYPPRTQLGGISVGSGDIVGHGYRFGVLARFGGYTSVNGAQLAKLTAHYTMPHAVIRLGTCFGGYGGRISVAQLLANASGKEVHAASGYYTMFSAIRDLDRVYRPLTGVARLASDITGKAVSAVVRTTLDGGSVVFRGPLQVAQQGFATQHEI